MAKKAKPPARREWTTEDVKELKRHSKAKTPLDDISKVMNRTAGAVRQKATSLGIGLGHRR